MARSKGKGKGNIAGQVAATIGEVMGGGDKSGDDARGMQFGNYTPDKALRTERLYFKVTPTVKGYLQRAAWEESTISRRISMTDYVCKLIEDDMQKHPDWIPTQEDLDRAKEHEGE